jgi:hypothetical protein
VTPYEYLTVFIAVVLGLAVVHLLSGVVLLLDTRIRARLDWIHGVWTANVLVTTVLVWWHNFRLTEVTEWTLPFFLNLVAYSVVLYLLSGLLYPVRGSEVVDFEAHFEANRMRFFMVALVFQVVDFADTILEASALNEDVNALRLGLIAVYAIGFLLALGTRSRVYHGTLAVAWFVTCLFWGFKALDSPILVS